MPSPSEPSASRRPSRQESFYTNEERQSEQAGRSATNLHAQLSAASLRSQRLRSQSHKSTRSSVDENHILSASSVAPATLQPTRSNTSDGSSRDGSDGSAQDARNKEANAAGIALSQGLPPPPPIPTSRPSEMRQISSSTSLARAATPRSVRDLGRDFDRYYNPFATPNHSTTDLTVPLPRYNSAEASRTGSSSGTQGEQSRRHSNPFADEKHLPNSFESKAATSTAAPVVAMAASKNELVDNNDPEKAFFPYLDDRLGAPDTANQGYTFPLYWHEKEWDDDMHLPMIDDDVKLKPHWKDHFTRENVISTFGLAFMIVGLLCVFVMLPVLSWSGFNIINYDDTPLDKMWAPNASAPITWATIDPNRRWPLLKNMRTGLIDPDTPQSAMTRTGVLGDEFKLVFSDEFNAINRTFYSGDDPYWTAPDIWYGATRDLEWYDPDAVTTWDGALHLQLDSFGNHDLEFRSGMLNSWNQLCFKGGIFEVSVSLPGPAGIHALWPGVWSMGNLGRPGYLATTEGVWPYTYSDCDAGITPNQSDFSGISILPGQKLASCVCPNEDHPTPGKGRGAPEIDIIEMSADWGGMGIGVATQSYQIAPFDPWWYANADFMEFPNYELSFVNTWTGNPTQQAVSATTMLNNDWYDGKAYQRYAYEYAPGITEDSYIAWTVGDEMMMRFDARALGPNGNSAQRIISEEPMSMILNLGISTNWVDINWTAVRFPTIMRVDYVRIYQKEGEEMITCDPPGYETTEYIKNHPEAYNNPNYTQWTDIPGYTWPKNSLMHGC